LQAAVYSRDEMLLAQGLVEVHNALLPFLHLHSCPGELLTPLMHVHTALQMIRNLVQDSLEDQEAMRETAARVAGTLSMHCWRLAGSFCLAAARSLSCELNPLTHAISCLLLHNVVSSRFF
jgi:hypothetical protein